MKALRRHLATRFAVYAVTVFGLLLFAAMCINNALALIRPAWILIPLSAAVMAVIVLLIWCYCVNRLKKDCLRLGIDWGDELSALISGGSLIKHCWTRKAYLSGEYFIDLDEMHIFRRDEIIAVRKINRIYDNRRRNKKRIMGVQLVVDSKKAQQIDLFVADVADNIEETYEQLCAFIGQDPDRMRGVWEEK